QINNRYVWCDKYIVAGTYYGWQIRTPSEDCNKHLLDVIRHEAARVFGEGLPVQIIPPNRPPGTIDYPPVRVTTEFVSAPIRDEMHISSLIVVWFQNQQVSIPDESNHAAIAAIDWEQLALDGLM